PAPLTVWTANLEHLFPEHNWRTFVERVAAAPRAPDLLFLTEVTRGETHTVVDALQEGVGSNYLFEHTTTGSNAVVWSTDRFGDAAVGNPLLWKPYGDIGCREPSTSDPSEVVGVRLRDAQAGKGVVAVAVHWGKTWAAECMEKNISALDAKIDELGRTRPLTIVAGDFNAHPDKQPVPGDPSAETLESGRETDPDCWYRAFSALHDETLQNPRPNEDDSDCSNDPNYSKSSDSYVDTVFAANEPDALCEQWTSIHGGPVAGGTSCTDLNDDDLRDRGRIDYIWVRWDDGHGEVVVPDAAEIRRLIPDAAADQLCILDSCAETRYSDHRGVWAVIGVDPR
ncbi:MAG: endonuclease/exonuclease/phosphatase family protein, partial [Actinomycetota bacterium]|nr:endonuclease/exonuclease/phosphatase family protein [Actinomycetota bacterium]